MSHHSYKSDRQSSSHRRLHSPDSDSRHYREDRHSYKPSRDGCSPPDRYSYKSKYEYSDDEEDDGRNTVEISGLEKSITEKDIEKIVRNYAIKYGFSPPKSVVLFANTTNYTHNFVNIPNDIMETNTVQVEFPSSSAVLRLLKALKIPKIQVKGHYYQVTHLDKIAQKNPADITITQSSSKGTIQMNNSLIKIFCDWNCTKCGFFNFSKRSTCLQCGTDRPEEFQLQSLSYLTNISNLSHEYSSWVVVKDIPNCFTPSDLIKFLGNVLPNITCMERCYYFSASCPTNFGFLFAVFPSLDSITSYFDMAGSKNTSQVFNDIFMRVDLMLLKERVVANDLIEHIKFESVTKEYFENQFGNNKHCKVHSTTVDSLNEALNNKDYEVRFSGYVGNWLGKIIWFSSGKTEAEKWPKDPLTGYFYNATLNLYFDPKSCYYMLASGGYFVWDLQSSSLVKVDPSEQVLDVKDIHEPDECVRKPPESAKILEEAKKMAKASHSVHVPTFRDDKTSVSKQFTAETVNEDTGTGKIPIKLNLFAKKREKISDNFSENKAIETKAKPSQIDISAELICFVCLRYFENPSQLDKHVSLSEYHKFILSMS